MTTDLDNKASDAVQALLTGKSTVEEICRNNSDRVCMRVAYILRKYGKNELAFQVQDCFINKAPGVED